MKLGRKQTETNQRRRVSAMSFGEMYSLNKCEHKRLWDNV